MLRACAAPHAYSCHGGHRAPEPAPPPPAETDASRGACSVAPAACGQRSAPRSCRRHQPSALPSQPRTGNPREAAVPREASGHCSRPTPGTQPVTARLPSTPYPPPCSSKAGDWTPPVNRLCAASSPSCSRSRTLAVASTAPEAGAAPLVDQLPVLPAPAEPTRGHHTVLVCTGLSPLWSRQRRVCVSRKRSLLKSVGLSILLTWVPQGHPGACAWC